MPAEATVEHPRTLDPEAYREPSASGYKHARFWSSGDAIPVMLVQGDASVEVDALFE